ncbi:hypothetical protein H6F32_05545 [Anabaena sp. FACHB-1237]|uniref:hypothetical protein n=1 Tax=Anabaena sp. FACHB-1237 TaxID=2692769 RepID=UPI001680469E|nr:hypothetical protein [Anabaena sp. FACHB-1237]MBD2137060.1 hypothetical protein [Anabaena sp. FACHB-1237]
MARKKLADLIQAEAQIETQTQAQKYTPSSTDSVIEIAAEPVKETATVTQDITQSTASDFISVQESRLLAKIKDLQDTIITLQEKGMALQQQVNDLQIALAEKQAFTEKLNQELDETKKTALQLAHSNSNLLEEIELLKQPTAPPAIVKKDIYHPAQSHYKKDHRQLPVMKEKPESNKEDFGKNTWLYD